MSCSPTAFGRSLWWWRELCLFAGLTRRRRPGWASSCSPRSWSDTWPNYKTKDWNWIWIKRKINLEVVDWKTQVPSLWNSSHTRKGLRSACLVRTKKKKNDVGGSGSGLHSDRVANHTETASKKWVSVRVFGPHQRSCKADQTAQPSRSGSPEELEDGQVGVGCQSWNTKHVSFHSNDLLVLKTKKIYSGVLKNEWLETEKRGFEYLELQVWPFVLATFPTDCKQPLDRSPWMTNPTQWINTWHIESRSFQIKMAPSRAAASVMRSRVFFFRSNGPPYMTESLSKLICRVFVVL